MASRLARIELVEPGSVDGKDGSFSDAEGSVDGSDASSPASTPTATRRNRRLLHGLSVLPLVLLLIGVQRLAAAWLSGGGRKGGGDEALDGSETANTTRKPARAGPPANLSALEADRLELAEGMMLPNQTLAQEYHRQPYCRDTPLWANGYPCVDEGKTAEQGCTHLGWTCAGYQRNGLCGGGQRRVGDWAFGRGVQHPELNCCECGGSADKGGSCRKYGCDQAYDPAQLCQCNPECEEHHNCCWDHLTVCRSGLAIGGYVPRNPALLLPSTSATQTFYVYRAQTHESFKPALANVNAASLGAVLWYLHNEVVYKCPRRGSIYAKYDIIRILRYKVTHKPTQPLVERGMHYGPFCAYDYAACTGPGNRHGEDWAKYGYNIGCEFVGDWPHELFGSAKSYPNAIWYSFPGACPNEDLPHKSAACVSTEPGGYTEGSEPTGAGNSTYTFEAAGEIDIDELVGITPRWRSHAAFCQQGCAEYRPEWNRGTCGVHFWDHQWDPQRNALRVRQADDLFFQHFPDLPRDRDLPAPPCDFNKVAFYRDHMPSPP